MENEFEVIKVDTIKIKLMNGNKVPLVDYLTIFKMDLHKEKVFSNNYKRLSTHRSKSY